MISSRELKTISVPDGFMAQAGETTRFQDWRILKAPVEKSNLTVQWGKSSVVRSNWKAYEGRVNCSQVDPSSVTETIRRSIDPAEASKLLIIIECMACLVRNHTLTWSPVSSPKHWVEPSTEQEMIWQSGFKGLTIIWVISERLTGSSFLTVSPLSTSTTLMPDPTGTNKYLKSTLLVFIIHPFILAYLEQGERYSDEMSELPPSSTEQSSFFLKWPGYHTHPEVTWLRICWESLASKGQIHRWKYWK